MKFDTQKTKYFCPNELCTEHHDLMVSVIMITYGHGEFIEEAMNSVLMQKCDFKFELIIANDCSPDSTDSVVKKALKNHNNDTSVKYSRLEKNVGMMTNLICSLKNAKGKFIAICDGDDYWTDPFKLQKQVDFLEENTRFSFCCHRYQIYSENDKQFDTKTYPLIFNPYDHKLKGVVIDKSVYHSNWITQPLTVVFRKNLILEFDLGQFKYFRDVHLFYLLLIKGKGFCHEWVAGVYRKNEGGVYSGSNNQDKSKDAVLIAEELYLFSGDVGFFKMYLGNAFRLLIAKKHLKILFKSFIIRLSSRDKLKMLRVTFQHFRNGKS